VEQQHVVVTVSGSDRTGLVKEVTRTLLDNEGNIEAARMARLGGDFVMLMLVSVPAPRVGEVESALRLLSTEKGAPRLEVQTRVTEWEMSDVEKRPVCGLTVMGADHVGIIHDIAENLSKRGVSIVTMDTDVVAAPMSGTPLFTMSAVLGLPNDLEIDELRHAMELVGTEAGVEISVLTQTAEE
jgi:glycine cleavage system transcriptional repressor